MENWCDWSLFGEEQVRTIQRQVAINLIGRNHDDKLDAYLRQSVHQNTGANDVGLEEDARIFDGNGQHEILPQS